MQIPFHVKLRRTFKALLSSSLSKIFATKRSSEKIKIDNIHSIVLVRPNYRIGNLIFLTPLINELSNNLPDVKIDIVVGNKTAGKILEGMPQVEQIIDIPRKLLKNPLSLFSFIKQNRAKKYDLAINISGGSLSSQIVTTLLNAKYKASFLSEQNFLPLTHTVHREYLFTHSGSQPLEFLKLFEGVTLPQNNLQLDIKLSDSEIAEAKNELQALLPSPSMKPIALFRGARFDKKIADEWWIELFHALKKLDENIIVIDILSPDVPVKASEEFLEYSNKNLRALGAFFQVCSMYISADTGPLHLASASKATTVALLNKTSAETYGLLGENDVTIDINPLSPKEVAELCYEKVLSK